MTRLLHKASEHTFSYRDGKWMHNLDSWDSYEVAINKVIESLATIFVVDFPGFNLLIKGDWMSDYRMALMTM